MGTMCIYPGPHSEKMSDEHYLPEALGRFDGMELLRYRLCSECNTSLGRRIETQFLRAGPTGFFRWLLGVQGKNGLSPVRPFYNRAAGTDPLYMIGRVEGIDCDLYWEMDAGSQDVYPLRQIVFDHPLAGSHAIPILDRMRDDVHLLLGHLKQKGLEHAEPIRVIAAQDEIPWVENLVRELGFVPPCIWTNMDLLPQRIPLTVRTHVTSAYFRAIAKIAFHYVLKMEYGLSGFEQEFDAIKRFIWEDEFSRDTSERFVTQLTDRQFILNFDRYRPRKWMHILAVERGGGIITAYAQFFAGPKALPSPYLVRIGKDPCRIITKPRWKAHMYVILDAGPDRTPRGIMEDANPANHVWVSRSR